MEYTVNLTFTEPLLGTVALNKELVADYIASKAPSLEEANQEVESVEESMEKSTTGFHRVDGQPILYDYVLKGFFKDACSMLRRCKGTRSSKVTAYKKIIDGLLFVKPRQVPINVAGEMGYLERPLRAQTAQGERVALARSEMIPAGSSVEFRVKVLDGITEDLLREWLDYGTDRGLGQWRNGGYGVFEYTLECV